MANGKIGLMTYVYGHKNRRRKKFVDYLGPTYFDKIPIFIKIYFQLCKQ